MYSFKNYKNVLLNNLTLSLQKWQPEMANFS